MMYLGETQNNTALLLSTFAVDSDGWLYDPETVEFRILDQTGVTNVYPAAPSTYEDITLTGAYSTGIWYAPGGPDGTSWDLTVDTRYVCEFRHRESATASWVVSRLSFDVVADLFQMAYRSYISPKEVRDNGITVAQLSNARLAILIPRAIQLIERATRQPFRPVLVDAMLDGNHSPLMQLPIPIIGLEDVYMNGEDTATEHDWLAVYNGANPFQDDRKNPRVKFRNSVVYSSSVPIWERPSDMNAVARFVAGNKNQRVIGVFGYLEEDGSAPRLITEAAYRLVNANYAPVQPGGGSGVIVGAIKKEVTDRHSIEYDVASASAQLENPLFGDAVTEEIIGLLKGPPIVTGARDFWVV